MCKCLGVYVPRLGVGLPADLVCWYGCGAKPLHAIVVNETCIPE